MKKPLNLLIKLSSYFFYLASLTLRFFISSNSESLGELDLILMFMI